MISVTIICLILSLGSWLGWRGYIGSLLAVILGILGFAIYKRRKILAVFCVILIVGPVSYYYFGYWTIAELACSICGKKEGVIFIGNIDSYIYYKEQYETDLSKFYRDIGLKPHSHEWRSVDWTVHHWGGQWECFDTFGFFLYHLRLLYNVSQKVDQANFKKILEDYNARQQDPVRASRFSDRCEQIMSNENK
jgi:hypothetical protein